MLLAASYDLGIPDIGLMLVKLLAVVGGIAVGAIGLPWFFKLVVRVMTGQKLPPRVMKTFRVLGGLAIGLLIWTWVFSSGEGGLGGSGGGWWPFGQGGGKGTATQKAVEAPATPKKEPVAPTPTAESVPIHLLGGSRVHEQRFYVLDHDPPRNLAELTKALEERKQSRPALDRLDILIYKDSVDHSNPAVTELIRWAQEHGFQTRQSIIEQNAP